MPHILAARRLVERDAAGDAGQAIQDWVRDQPAGVIFALTIIAVFLAIFVFLTIAWETVRACRRGFNGPREEDLWYRLPDGSSMQVNGDHRWLGPMNSALRESRADRRGQGHGYVQTRSGATPEMVGEANSLSGTYGAYDPPPMQNIQRYRLEDPPQGFGQSQQYPPAQQQRPPRPESFGTTGSGWSGETRIPSVPLEKDKPTDSKLYLPVQTPPPQPSQPAVAAALSAPVTPALQRVFSTEMSVSNSIKTDNTLPYPNSPRTSQISSTSGEAAFSTPKPAASPVSHLRSGSTPAPPVLNAGRPTHARTGSVPFQPKPLGLVSSGVSRASTTGSTATIVAPEPPKVDLKRTWSLASWIPSAAKGEQEEEEAAMALVRKASGQGK
ncbi:hypothetical protein JCM10207_008153 [Rhodosporidiobolus poonsookiae]